MIVFMLVLLAGCFDSGNEKDTYDLLMEYKGSYIGDAAAIGNILSLLELEYNGFYLKTDEEPYCLVINTTDDVLKNEKALKICTAVVFVLISNSDNITYNSANHSLSFHRSEIDNKYMLNLYDSVNNKEELLDLFNS